MLLDVTHYLFRKIAIYNLKVPVYTYKFYKILFRNYGRGFGINGWLAL